MHHGIYGLVATHAAHVDILMEILLAVFHGGTRHLRGQDSQTGMFVGCGGVLALHLTLVASLQLFGLHLRAHIAKDNGDLLALDVFHCTNGVETFDTHGVTLLEGTVEVVGAVAFSTEGLLALVALLLLLCFLGLALRLACLALFHLAKFPGKVFLAHQSAGVVALHLLAELLQFFANLAGTLFLSLRLTNLADGILNLTVGLGQQFLSLLLGALQDLLAFALNLLEVGLIALDMSFEVLLVLVDGLALAFPVTFVAYDVLQVFVALDIVLAYNVGGVLDDFLRQTGLAGYLDGKRGTGLTDTELEQGLHLVTVVEHRTVDNTLVVVGEMLQVLIVGGNHAEGFLLPELLQDGLGNGAANHGFRTATKLVY